MEVRTITRGPAAQVTRAMPRDRAHQAGEGRKGAADPRHSAEAEEAGGNPERLALAVRKAWAAAGVAGAAAAVVAFAGEPNGSRKRVELALCGSFLQSNFGGSSCGSKPAE